MRMVGDSDGFLLVSRGGKDCVVREDVTRRAVELLCLRAGLPRSIPLTPSERRVYSLWQRGAKARRARYRAGFRDDVGHTRQGVVEEMLQPEFGRASRIAPMRLGIRTAVAGALRTQDLLNNTAGRDVFVAREARLISSGFSFQLDTLAAANTRGLPAPILTLHELHALSGRLIFLEALYCLRSDDRDREAWFWALVHGSSPGALLLAVSDSEPQSLRDGGLETDVPLPSPPDRALPRETRAGPTDEADDDPGVRWP